MALEPGPMMWMNLTLYVSTTKRPHNCCWFAIWDEFSLKGFSNVNNVEDLDRT